MAMLVLRRVTGTFFQDFGGIEPRGCRWKYLSEVQVQETLALAMEVAKKCQQRLMVLRSVDTHLLIWRISHVPVRFHSSQVVIAGFQPSTLAFLQF